MEILCAKWRSKQWLAATKMRSIPGLPEVPMGFPGIAQVIMQFSIVIRRITVTATINLPAWDSRLARLPSVIASPARSPARFWRSSYALA